MFWGLCVKTQCGPIRVSRLSHRTRHLFQVSLLASLHSWNRVKPMLIRKRNFLCDCVSLRSSPIDHRWWKSPSFHQTSLCPELGIVCTEWYLIFCELLKREKKLTLRRLPNHIWDSVLLDLLVVAFTYLFLYTNRLLLLPQESSFWKIPFVFACDCLVMRVPQGELHEAVHRPTAAGPQLSVPSPSLSIVFILRPFQEVCHWG